MSENEISQMFARVKEARPDLLYRLGKAEKLLVDHLRNPRRGIIKARVTNRVIFLVHSQSQFDTVYEVDGQTCTCKWVSNGNKHCTHVLAVMALRKILRVFA